MRHPRQIVSTLVLAILFLFAVPSEANTYVCFKVKPITLRWVRGRVVDEVGDPIAQARVDLLSAGAVLASVQTDNDGLFSFQAVEAGDYELRAQSTGFHTDEYPVVLKKPTSNWKGLAEMVLNVASGCPNVRVRRR